MSKQNRDQAQEQTKPQSKNTGPLSAGEGYKVRDPEPINRDPELEPRRHKPRRYIPASMPTVCPECQENTRMSGGRYVDPVRKRIIEYRTCINIKCLALLGAGRPMTKTEVATLCTHADAVADYEQTEGKP